MDYSLSDGDCYDKLILIPIIHNRPDGCKRVLWLELAAGSANFSASDSAATG